MLEYTTEQKYNWLVSKLKLTDIDYYEQDAFLNFPDKLFVLFDHTEPPLKVDRVICRLMANEHIPRGEVE